MELDNDDNGEAVLHNFLEDENLEVGIDPDDVGTNATITLEGVRDSIVSSRTLRGYVGEIIKFLVWCVENKPNWLTDNGRGRIAHITEEHGGEGVRAQRSCTRAAFLGLLRSCDESTVFLLGEVTPRGAMEYAMGHHHVWGGQGYLSKSAYGQICAAVSHLFCVHNCVGFSENFCKELGNYFCGFYRQLTQQPHQQEAIGEPLQTDGGAGAVVVNPAPCQRRINKEGKDPMSVDLYKKLYRWLLDWNTNDGVFGHCFLVLTWNLSCHAHNTANIWLCEIEWGSTFDMFEIYFAHMKTDQTGDEAKYSRHLYANPFCPLICPVLSLAFYFSCCFNLPQTGESRLFLGRDQYQWFLEMLSRLIRDHEAEVSELGVNPQMIGMHSRIVLAMASSGAMVTTYSGMAQLKREVNRE